MLTAGMLAFASCTKDEGIETTSIPTFTYTTNDDGDTVSVSVKGSLDEDVTFTADRIWYLNGFVDVADGATLTIEAGTIIKGNTGQETSASALIVGQGGTLDAQGTSSEPIIFTSALDDIAVGETASTLSTSQNGLWGGLIILGKAPISVTSDATTSFIEGIPSTETFSQYGGTDATDNSGTLSYISIRYGGTLIGSDNEINGLTLGGVGTGTSISNIEIVSNLDDGIEFFGGTVDVTNLLVWGCGDDAIDTDQGWSGTLSNFYVIDAGNSAFELDGPEGSDDATAAKHTIEKGTVDGFGDHAIDMDDDSNVILDDISFLGISGNADLAVANASESLDAANSTVTNIEADGDATNVTAAELFPNITLGTATGSTADFSWTFASSEGAL